MSPVIGIFPASGGLGGSITKHLLSQYNPDQVVLISRNPSKNAHLGAETRQADYDDPDSLTKVFHGIDVLMLISYPSIEREHRFACHKSAIDEAEKSGVSHIFYSSLAFAKHDDNTSEAFVMQAHLLTEEYLRGRANENSEFTYTSMRMGIYSESFPMYIGFPDLQKPEDEVKIPHDGSGPGIAWAKRDELGGASASAIRQFAQGTSTKQQFKNSIVLLSGTRTLSLVETTKAVGRAANRQIKIQQCSEQEYVERPEVQNKLGSHGPGRVPEQWVTVYSAIRSGETSVISPSFGDLLGREPEKFEETVRGLLSS